MKECDQFQHNLIVVSWRITTEARIARQFMCSNCLHLLDMEEIQEHNKKRNQKDD